MWPRFAALSGTANIHNTLWTCICTLLAARTKHAVHHVQCVLHDTTAAATSAPPGQHVCYKGPTANTTTSHCYCDQQGLNVHCKGGCRGKADALFPTCKCFPQQLQPRLSRLLPLVGICAIAGKRAATKKCVDIHIMQKGGQPSCHHALQEGNPSTSCLGCCHPQLLNCPPPSNLQHQQTS